MAIQKFIDAAGLSRVLSKIKATYVQKETGKSLISDELITKLGGIAAGAQVNVIETVKVNGEALPVNEKAVDITVPTKHSDLGVVAESDLASDLKQKVNAAAEGNHSHANKEELDKFVEGDKAKYDQAVTDLGTVSGKVDTLIGEDANKSVRTIAAEELAAKLIPENAAESLNELNEIAAWIQSHPGDASAMNAAILALQKQLQGFEAGEGTVKTYVDNAITALNIGDYAKASELTALAARVKAIEDDYLKATDKAGLEQAISDGDAATLASAKTYADGLNTAMGARVKAIEDDYVKASELTALTEAEIDEVWNSIA